MYGTNKRIRPLKLCFFLRFQEAYFALEKTARHTRACAQCNVAWLTRVALSDQHARARYNAVIGQLVSKCEPHFCVDVTIVDYSELG